MTLVKKELNLFFIALGFLTRIPIPASVDFEQSKLNHASRYFPLVGWVIGLVCGFVYWFFSLHFPAAIAILLSMLVSVLITGCFHEDGLADTCDGFGGGWSAQQKLSIMKDSRVGTYGATSIWFVLTLKFVLLLHLDNVLLALLVAHSVSRSVATSLIYFLPYVSDDSNAKVKPLAETTSKNDCLISLVIGLAALFLVSHVFVSLVVSLLLSYFVIRFVLLKQIKGFTGDTLGATQQLTELIVYLVLIAG